MLYAQNRIFEAQSCHVDFIKEGRFVLLIFDDDVSRIVIRATESDMAALAGRFIKERLFGLH